MRFLLLCDASQPKMVAPICHENNCGVEMQSFSNPDYPLQEKDGLKLHKSLYESIYPKSLHGPFGDLSPGSCDRLIRKVTKERFNYIYKYAQLLGAEHIVLHHGYIPNTNSRSGWLNRSIEFWLEFLTDKDPGINFYLENLLENDSSLLGEVLRSVNHPNLKACLDVGHAFCHGKISVEKWIEDLGDLIGYVHLHDNLGDRDTHLALGEGRIPLDQVCYSLERLAPKSIWALEVGVQNLEDSLFWLESHGYFPGG